MPSTLFPLACRRLSQADVVAGVFGSTFVKTALQLGSAPAYISLDSFPWCPLLRCFWGWRDMCHNCDICNNLGGSGEACGARQYHGPGGLRRVMRDQSVAKRAFRRFIETVNRDFRCSPFAYHPMGSTLFDKPVVGTLYAPPLPQQPRGWPERRCVDRGGGGSCACGFMRYAGVNNAAAQWAKPARGFGLTSPLLPSPSLESCEAACCKEPLCHSAVWAGNESRCVLSLSIAHGARETDWCWHPVPSAGAVTSLRLPGEWEAAAVEGAQRVLVATQLVRRRDRLSSLRAQPSTFRKEAWTDNYRWHYGQGKRTKRGVSCSPPPSAAGSSGVAYVSSLVADAIPSAPGGLARCGDPGGRELAEQGQGVAGQPVPLLPEEHQTSRASAHAFRGQDRLDGLAGT